VTRDALREQLRRVGLRATSQRLLVLELVNQHRHLNVDELTEAAAQAGESLDLSTAYRTLEALDEAGLLTHAHLGAGAPTYHVVDAVPHIHLVCRRCGSIGSISAQRVEPAIDAVSAATGFSADLRHLVLHGICATCTAEPKERDEQRR